MAKKKSGNQENRQPTYSYVPYDQIERFYSDFTYRAPFLYHIRNVDGGIVPYQPNEAQTILSNIIDEELRRNYQAYGIWAAYLIYLKSRRMGMSTDCTARNTDGMLWHDRHHVQVIAHDDDGTSMLYRQYTTMFEHLPDFVAFTDPAGQVVYEGGAPVMLPIKPEGEPTKQQIQYEDKTLSYLNVFTAGKGDMGGKGGSLNRVHLSEVANYRSYKDLISSVSQQLEGAHQFAVKESTPNGMTGIGESFYRDYTENRRAWDAYRQGKAHSFEGWRPVFLPWYWMDSYRMPLDKQGRKIYIEDLFDTKEERNKYLDWEEWVEQEVIPKDEVTADRDCDPQESTNFYRWLIKKKCERDLAKARRYYPTTEEEAFISNDDTFFNVKRVHQVGLELAEDKASGRYPYVVGNLTDNLEFEPTANGNFYVKEFPDPSWINRYVVSNDQSEGFEGGDFQNIAVFDRLNQQFVANYRSLESENEIATILTKIAMYYVMAYLVPEANRQTVINIVKPRGLMPYQGDVYVRRSGKKRGRSGQVQYGYAMNAATRTYALNRYLNYLEPEDGGDRYADALYFDEAIEEHKHFIRHIKMQRSVYQAAEGHTDDIVISNALCVIGDEEWSSPLKPAEGDWTADHAETADDYMKRQPGKAKRQYNGALPRRHYNLGKQNGSHSEQSQQRNKGASAPVVLNRKKMRDLGM